VVCDLFGLILLDGEKLALGSDVLLAAWRESGEGEMVGV
jgi:hypothetical protein